MGSDNYDQLTKIVEIFGSEEILRFQINYRSEILEQYNVGLLDRRVQKKEFRGFRD